MATPTERAVHDSRPPDVRWLGLFTDKYGPGSYERLMSLLRESCVTFADIAAEFRVTRERVRQWHLELLPGTPRGHQRKHLCLVQRQKKQLFADQLFRTFYRNARNHFAAHRFVLIPASDGFRKRAVRLDDAVIALKAASLARRPAPDNVKTYALGGHAGEADFIYYRLSGEDFLFVPRRLMPATGTTFLDTDASKYQRFRNTFHAALAPSPRTLMKTGTEA
jgi:hypothetical protein